MIRAGPLGTLSVIRPFNSGKEDEQKATMTLSELTCQIDPAGNLLIPADVIRDIGLVPGDLIHIAYISRDGVSNDYQEFLLSASGIENMEEEETTFHIPTRLLEQANIPADSDLQIAFSDGLIIISGSSTLDLEEWGEVLERLEKTCEYAEHFRFDNDIAQVQAQLADEIEHYQEGGEHSERTMPDEA